MSNEVYLDNGPRSSLDQRRDWRLILVAIGAVLILVAYCLPIFSRHIAAATTTFSLGTVVEREYPVLIYDQYYTQTDLPKDEELVGVQIVVAPVPFSQSLGWSWLLRTMASRMAVYASFWVVLLLPILAALLGVLLVSLAWFSRHGVIEALIPPTLNLAVFSPFALALAWLHQFDFSALLLSQNPAGLMPGVGFWVGLLATLPLLVGMVALRRETRRRVVTWWALVLAVAVLAWALTRIHPQPYLEIWRFISDGIVVTLRIVVTSFGFILLVSLLGGLGRISKSRIIYGLASLYVELIRGIPLMVQLLFIWFALPQVLDSVGGLLMAISPGLAATGQALIDLQLNPFTAAVLGLTICYGAYGSEIFRAGISSIHHGQMEAARSLGMTYIQAMRHIVLPQAVRVILPPIGNEFVALLKDSSLVSVLAVSDLTRRGREYMSRTFLSFDTWIMVALCYLVLTLFSSRAVEFIESKTRFERR